MRLACDLQYLGLNFGRAVAEVSFIFILRLLTCGSRPGHLAYYMHKTSEMWQLYGQFYAHDRLNGLIKRPPKIIW